MFTRLRNLHLLFAAFAALTGSIVESSYASPRPNILFMTADDMHWDSVGVYQSPVKGITPHLDRLAGEGFMFRHAYVQIAILATITETCAKPICSRPSQFKLWIGPISTIHGPPLKRKCIIPIIRIAAPWPPCGIRFRQTMRSNDAWISTSSA